MQSTHTFNEAALDSRWAYTALSYEAAKGGVAKVQQGSQVALRCPLGTSGRGLEPIAPPLPRRLTPINSFPSAHGTPLELAESQLSYLWVTPTLENSMANTSDCCKISRIRLTRYFCSHLLFVIFTILELAASIHKPHGGGRRKHVSVQWRSDEYG